MGEEAQAESANGQRGAGKLWRGASRCLLLGALVAAPLMVGSVHRAPVTIVLGAVALALVLALLGAWRRRRMLEGVRSSHFFVLLLLIPLLQAVPLPRALRNGLDPAGGRLLENAPAGTAAMWPLSLDPLATRTEIGSAAAALAAFLLALNVTAGRSGYKAIAKAIAIAGGIAILSGILHRLLGLTAIYGSFPSRSGLLVGPFINPNHCAELFELAAFAALAVGIEARGEAKLGWYAIALCNAGAALATLSRGAVLALLAGLVAFVVLRARGDYQEERRARTAKLVLWVGVATGLVLAFALALGAAPLREEFAQTDLAGKREKDEVWKDSLPIVASHPAGIGRRAYDRVYPAYKALSWQSRFNFVENAPLQLLIDVGWLGFLGLAISFGFVIRRLVRHERKDAAEAALLAALIAVGAHNLVDFGLETVGIRLPFAALAGVVFGRSYRRERREGTDWTATVVPATALAGVALGLFAVWRTTPDDLEKRWKASTSPTERRGLAIAAARLAPTDYFYPLLQSLDEPLAPEAGSRSSPKLAALNRALRLCSSCAEVHREAGRALFRAGRRPQALAAWRDWLHANRDIFQSDNALQGALAELDGLGVKPAELATLTAAGNANPLVVAEYLAPKGAGAEAPVEALLEEARTRGAPLADVGLVRARLAMALGRDVQARTLIEQALALAPRDARAHMLMAVVEEKAGRLEQALAQVREAANLAPGTVPYAKYRIRLIIHIGRWVELEEALTALQGSLRRNGESMFDFHVYAGDALQIRGDLARSAVEYRNALAIDPQHAQSWAELARVTMAQGDIAGAVDAYEKVVAITPNDAAARAELDRLRKARAAAGWKPPRR